MGIYDFVNGKTVLITGGTGSFGTTILRRLLGTSVREIRVFSRDEQKHYRLSKSFSDPRIKSIVGDVRDRRRVMDAVAGVDVVFHAAAIKHVPIAELHPHEAVATNIVGVQNVLDALRAIGFAGRFVAVSTDKAVEPVNVMGMTKAVQERIVTGYKGGFVACCVRYGNVLSSNGSVVPFFRKCIDDGVARLPITHADMTRFVLTLDQAVDLVFFALANAEDGDLFVSDIRSHKVIDMADALLTMAGRSPGEWEVVGIRAGEKLHETLLSAEEMRRAVKMNDAELRQGFYKVRPAVDGSVVSACEPLTSEKVGLTVDDLMHLLRQS